MTENMTEEDKAQFQSMMERMIDMINPHLKDVHKHFNMDEALIKSIDSNITQESEQ